MSRHSLPEDTLAQVSSHRFVAKGNDEAQDHQTSRYFDAENGSRWKFEESESMFFDDAREELEADSQGSMGHWVHQNENQAAEEVIESCNADVCPACAIESDMKWKDVVPAASLDNVHVKVLVRQDPRKPDSFQLELHIDSPRRLDCVWIDEASHGKNERAHFLHIYGPSGLPTLLSQVDAMANQDVGVINPPSTHAVVETKSGRLTNPRQIRQSRSLRRRSPGRARGPRSKKKQRQRSHSDTSTPKRFFEKLLFRQPHHINRPRSPDTIAIREELTEEQKAKNLRARQERQIKAQQSTDTRDTHLYRNCHSPEHAAFAERTEEFDSEHGETATVRDLKDEMEPFLDDEVGFDRSAISRKSSDSILDLYISKE